MLYSVARKIICISLIMLYFSITYTKILIITPVYNRPDFIEWQYWTFKKFLKDDYEFKVFNDADNQAMQQEIETTCSRLGIPCIRVPQNCHNVDPLCYRAPASFRHGESLQFAFDNYGFKHDDIVVLIDSDVFLIREFSVREFLDGYDILGYGGHHLFPQLCFINMPRLHDLENVNFRAGYLPDGHFMDVSCYNELYIKNHPEIKWKVGTLHWGIHDNSDPYCLHVDKEGDISAQLSGKGYTMAEIQLIKSIINVCDEALKINPNNTKVLMECNIGFYENNIFLDYKHGSGWHGPNAAIKAKKDQIVKDFIYSLL